MKCKKCGITLKVYQFDYCAHCFHILNKNQELEVLAKLKTFSIEERLSIIEKRLVSLDILVMKKLIDEESNK